MGLITLLVLGLSYVSFCDIECVVNVGKQFTRVKLHHRRTLNLPLCSTKDRKKYNEEEVEEEEKNKKRKERGNMCVFVRKV